MTTHHQVGWNGEIMFDRVTVELGKMNGQPCIRGLRFTVAHLVRLVAAA
jgi:uncharacterized protein (DUF433 family)